MRLAALAEEVVRDTQEFGSVSPLLAVDVWQTRDWLGEDLAAGAPYRETRAAALLNGALTLGAAWFADDRLLPATDQLAMAEDFDCPSVRLMETALAERFDTAARREEMLRPGLLAGLDWFLRRRPSAEAIAPLIDAAFPQEGTEVIVEDDDRYQNPAAKRFLGKETALLGHQGVVQQAMRDLSLAGDLVLGLGRCVRLLSGPGREAGAHLEAWLEEKIRDLSDSGG
jgi:hypothetical protein